MFFGILTLITGLALSVVAAWFAIEGIMAIFAGLPAYAMIMGIVIEAGKVVGITWIYRHWTKKTVLKWIAIPLVAIAMGLTSMGIYGLLAKAHIEQTAPVTNNTAKIERLDKRILRERTEIADAELIIDQLDATVQVLVDARKISHPTQGSRVVRILQQPQRDQLKQIIDESFDSIDDYEDVILSLNQQLNNLELEIGPVKYIAAVIFEDPQENFDKAVRIVIIAFIFVFDPMAIVLLMMGNYTLMGRIGATPPPAKKEEEILFGEPSPVVTSVEQLIDVVEPDPEPDPQIRDAVIHQIEVVEPEPEPEIESEPELKRDLIHHQVIFDQHKLDTANQEELDELENLPNLNSDQAKRWAELKDILDHKRTNEHSDSATRRVRSVSDNPPIKPEPPLGPSVLDPVDINR